MGKIFTTQDSLRIELTYLEDISDEISNVVIKYTKPDGVNGEWDNVIHIPSEKKVYYDLPKDTYLDQRGTWKFWLFATMSDGREIPGEVAKQIISEEGR